MKVFDYAVERDGGDVEVWFTDGSRYDIPAAEWRAIVAAAQSGRLTAGLNGPCECVCDGCLSGDHCDRASCAQPACP